MCSIGRAIPKSGAASSGNSPRAHRFYREASRQRRIALVFRRQTKREFQRRSNFEGYLRVEQNAGARDVPQLAARELRRLPRRANLHGHVNLLAHGFRVLFHYSPMKAARNLGRPQGPSPLRIKPLSPRPSARCRNVPACPSRVREGPVPLRLAVRPPHSIGFPLDCW
jgi:hypothetical protein